MASGVAFEADPDGISEICKSGPMRGLLGQVAGRIAAAANEDGESHVYADEFLPGGLDYPLYDSAVDELDHTCVGVAYAKTAIGKRNEERHKSLRRQRNGEWAL